MGWGRQANLLSALGALTESSKNEPALVIQHYFRIYSDNSQNDEGPIEYFSNAIGEHNNYSNDGMYGY